MVRNVNAVAEEVSICMVMHVELYLYVKSAIFYTTIFFI